LRRNLKTCCRAPSVLSENWDTFENDDLRLAVVGAGLTWAGVALQFRRSLNNIRWKETENAISRSEFTESRRNRTRRVQSLIRVAIKISSDRFSERFGQEARMVAALNH
jgi:hypothetical protein